MSTLGKINTAGSFSVKLIAPAPDKVGASFTGVISRFAGPETVKFPSEIV